MKTADIPAIMIEGAHRAALVTRVRTKVAEALRPLVRPRTCFLDCFTR